MSAMARRYLILLPPFLLLSHSLFHLSAEEGHQHLAALTPSVLWRPNRVERWVPASAGALVDTGVKDSLRTNLNQTFRYATTFIAGGWNNEVMEIFQLLHILDVLREDHSPQTYVPIIPPFTPNSFHLGPQAASTYHPLLPFGKVFDVPRLAAELQMPLIEMHELKEAKPCCSGLPEDQQALANVWWTSGGHGRDKLSCWSSDMTRNKVIRKGPGSEALEDVFGLDITWTPLPPFVHAPDPGSPFLIYQWLRTVLVPANPGTNILRYQWLQHPYKFAQKMLDEWGRDKKWVTQMGMDWDEAKEREKDGQRVLVDEVFGYGMTGWEPPEGEKDGDILCLDGLYWGSDRGGFPFQSPTEDGPALTIVPKAHWTREVEDMAWATVRRALKIEEGLDGKGVPDLITMHIRRGDFLQDCRNNLENGYEPCLLPKHFARKLEIVKDGLREQGIDADKAKVVVVTNEQDRGYLNELAAMGWVVVDHEELETSHHYGVWYPTILDAAILTFGKGIVGTSSSTMSILAFQRMIEWNPLFVSAYLGRHEVDPLPKETA